MRRLTNDGVVKTLHFLRHCKFNVITTYLSTPHSIKFAFLEYEVFYLAIRNLTFYEVVNKQYQQFETSRPDKQSVPDVNSLCLEILC